MTLSVKEQAIIAVVRNNKANQPLEIRREWKIGKYEICYKRKPNKEGWGRFGGGWNWKLGFQAGGKTIIISLLVADIRISKND